jgi:hypothetical protein
MNREFQVSVGFPFRGRGRLSVIQLVSRFLLLYLLACPAWSGNPAYPEEQLNYTISYRGVFSAMNWIEIADAVLQTEQQLAPVNGEQAYRSSFQVSTAGHQQMEQFYPLRYRFESYFSMDRQRTLLVDEQKLARKERREIVLVDWEQKTTSRYKKRKAKGREAGAAESMGAGQGTADLSPVLTELGAEQGEFRQANGADIRQLDVILDHLSMLHSVRGRELSPGQEIQLPVLDGDEILSYRVRVEKREVLQQKGQDWDTLKLRFDALAPGGEGDDSSDPPIYIWLTADTRRIPVRFASDYALGRFAGELTAMGDPMGDLVAALY